MLGGHKATLSNPSEFSFLLSARCRGVLWSANRGPCSVDTSEEAKKHSEQVLKDAGAK